MVDSENGLEIVFHSVRKNIDYSLVVVPTRIPFEVRYEKPSIASAMIMQPIDDPNWWNIHGEIDGDLFSVLGFEVDQPRRGSQFPIISKQNLEEARKWGILEEGAKNPKGNPVYDIDFRVHGNRVFNFLNRIWLPRNNELYQGISIPRIQVGNSTNRTLVLPQKKYKSSTGNDASLKVQT